MSPQQKITWTKAGKILGVIAVGLTIIAHLYNDIQSNNDSIRKAATEEATRQAERNAYRLRIEERLEAIEQRCSFGCIDSVKDAINELDNKTHLKPKF